jgi:hypothetical protein
MGASDRWCRTLWNAAQVTARKPASDVERPGHASAEPLTRKRRPRIAADERTSLRGSETWAGHIDHGDRNELSLALQSMSQYGLMIRLSDGHEGHFMFSAETPWSSGGMSAHGLALSGTGRLPT